GVLEPNRVVVARNVGEIGDRVHVARSAQRSVEHEAVVAPAAGDPVIPQATVENVVSTLPIHPLIAGRPIHRVDSGVTDDDIVEVVAREIHGFDSRNACGGQRLYLDGTAQLVAEVGQDGIGSSVAALHDDIKGAVHVEGIVSCAPVHRVVGFFAIDYV